jgi:hypothetical protein
MNQYDFFKKVYSDFYSKLNMSKMNTSRFSIYEYYVLKPVALTKSNPIWVALGQKRGLRTIHTDEEDKVWFQIHTMVQNASWDTNSPRLVANTPNFRATEVH